MTYTDFQISKALIDEIHKKLTTEQKEAYEFLKNRRASLLYDDMGLGKTLSSLFTLAAEEALPAIIICPKFAFATWQHEIMQWFGEESTVYTGTPKKRQQCWESFRDGKHKFLISNYAHVQEIHGRFLSGEVPGWGLIADEIDKSALLNHKTKGHKAFKKFAAYRGLKKVILMTGTPMRKGCTDFFAPLNIIEPKLFHSYWKFVDAHCVKLNNGYGVSILPRPTNIPKFREMLKQYSIRRMKNLKVGKFIYKVPCNLPSKKVLKVYKKMQDETFIFNDDGGLIITPNTISEITRMRQLLLCPRILGFEDEGTMIPTLIEKTEALVLAEEPIVVFTPYKAVIPYIEAAYKEVDKDIKIFKVTGGLSEKEFRDNTIGFQQAKGKKVAIAIIDAAASFTWTCASRAFFMDCSWSAKDNKQAEDRIYRMGQDRAAQIYYLHHPGTVHNLVLATVGNKQATEERLFNLADVKQGDFKKLI